MAHKFTKNEQRVYGYGVTDMGDSRLQYIGKRAPSGVKKNGYKLTFTAGGMYSIETGAKGKKQFSDFRWGGNRLGRKHTRENFLKDPKAMFDKMRLK